MALAPTPWMHHEGKVVAADQSIIARVRCSEACNTYNDEFQEVLDNAQLMAAAPELLEALESCQKALQDNLSKFAYKNEQIMYEAYIKAKTVIDKIKGEVE